MAERCRAQGENGRAHLWVGDDLDAEDVGESGAAVVAEGAENEVFAFLVEDEDAGEHCAFFFFCFSLSSLYYILCVRGGED